jgi:ABC-type multidrug transport system ATPase subunit
MVCQVRKIDPEKYINRFGAVFGLKEIFPQPMGVLSLGQTKRLFASVTLIDEAPIWILDEPSNGLDRGSQEFLIQCIQNHSQDHLVIFSEHNREWIKKFPGLQTLDLDDSR